MIDRSQAEAKYKPNFFKSASAIKPLCIVLDIDKTIAFALLSNQESLYNQYYKYLQNEHPEQIISVETEWGELDHVLCPGVLELIRYLCTMQCQLAFFSSGQPIRNKPFVEKLLMRALPLEEYQKVKDSIPVFSRGKDFFDTEEAPEPRHLYQSGRYKKDLNVVIDFFSKKGKKLSLNEIILVDDDLKNVMPEQEYNHLEMPGFNPTMTQPFFLDDKKRRFYFKSNQIFYMLGLLHTISAGPIPIEDLYVRQKRDKELVKDIRYYEIGLMLLRNVNPELDFFTLEAVASYKEPHEKCCVIF
jgi:hypothetical protein